MNQRIVGAACVLLAVGSAACGGGNANRAKLTDDQKSTLQQTVISFARTQVAAADAGKFKTGASAAGFSAVDSPVSSLLANVSSAVTVPSGMDEPAIQMRSRMNSRFSDQSCAVASAETTADDATLANPTLSPSGMMPSMNLAISGARCPVTMKMGFSTTVSSITRSGSVDIDWQYAVQDEDFRKLNDVDSFNIAGPIKVRAEDDSKLSIDADIRGDLHSQSRGTIQVTVSGHAEGAKQDGKGSFNVSFAYPSFTATLGIDLDGKDVHYFVGSDEVTADQFKAFFGGQLSAGSPDSLPFGR